MQNNFTITGKTEKTLAKVAAELCKQQIVFNAKFDLDIDIDIDNNKQKSWTIYLTGGY